VLEMRGPAIAVDELRKDFGTVLALDGLSLDVAPGKVMGLLGPNGLLRPVDPACGGRS
jgi:ABC-2 type transport system ATP-binding protein